jgi:hypothetical protein
VTLRSNPVIVVNITNIMMLLQLPVKLVMIPVYLAMVEMPINVLHVKQKWCSKEQSVLENVFLMPIVKESHVQPALF